MQCFSIEHHPQQEAREDMDGKDAKRPGGEPPYWTVLLPGKLRIVLIRVIAAGPAFPVINTLLEKQKTKATVVRVVSWNSAAVGRRAAGESPFLSRCARALLKDSF